MVKTKHFGEINVDETKVIEFEDGLPGFTHIKKYVLLANDGNEGSGPVFWLQSINESGNNEDADVALALVNPFAFYPNYSPEIKDEYVETLGHASSNDLSVFNVVVVPEDIKNMTVNLRAPILINQHTKKGAQVVSENQEYGVRHFLYQDIEKIRKTFEEGGK